MNITINENLVDVLAKLAALDDVTCEVYVERKINALLAVEYRRLLTNNIQNQSIENLKSFDTAIETVKVEIKAKEPKPVVEEVVPEVVEEVIAPEEVIN